MRRAFFLCLILLSLGVWGCDSLHSPTEPSDPIYDSHHQPPCIPSDRCDNQGPLPDSETSAILVEAMAEYRALNPDLETRVNWSDLPPVTWGTGQPGWIWSGREWCAGYTDDHGLHISVAQAWRRRGLLRHELGHWVYRAGTGDFDPNHHRTYINGGSGTGGSVADSTTGSAASKHF